MPSQALTSTSSKSLGTKKWLVLIALIVALIVQLFTTAWLSDDSAITIRTVLNFIHGYGAVFNIGERVQAYTHPLWFFLLSVVSLLTPNPLLAAFICSIGISIGVFMYLIWKIGNYTWAALLGASLLLLSKSYVDFSSSGLENPLSHLLLLLLYFHAHQLANATTPKAINHEQRITFLLAAFLILTRQDLLIIVLPILIWAIYQKTQPHQKTLQNLIIGFSPYFIWLIISLIYYGFIVPNTAFAKLNTGIPLAEKLLQGMHYLADLAHYDPMSLAIIALGVIRGFKSNAPNKLFAAGICLYLIYIIYIGGDFMSGRFFTAPILLAASILIQTQFLTQSILVFACLVVVGLFNLPHTLLEPDNLSNQMHAHGIADERSYFYGKYGLKALSPQLLSKMPWEHNDTRVQVGCGLMGFHSIAQGPNLFFVDSCALADPLLSKLPPQYHHPYWRIGHFVRQLPTNYERSIRANANLLADPLVHEYYSHLLRITRNELFDQERLLSILKINLRLLPRIDFHPYQFGFIPTDSRAAVFSLNSINGILQLNTSNSSAQKTYESSVEIAIPEIVSIHSIQMRIRGHCAGNIEMQYEGFFIPIAEFKPSQSNHINQSYVIEPPSMLTNRLRITNAVEGQSCQLEQLTINAS